MKDGRVDPLGLIDLWMCLLVQRHSPFAVGKAKSGISRLIMMDASVYEDATSQN